MDANEIIDALIVRIGDTGGKTYRAIYNEWAARPTKKGTPERKRAEAALAIARYQETPDENSLNQVQINLRFWEVR